MYLFNVFEILHNIHSKAVNLMINLMQNVGL